MCVCACVCERVCVSVCERESVEGSMEVWITKQLSTREGRKRRMELQYRNSTRQAGTLDHGSIVLRWQNCLPQALTSSSSVPHCTYCHALSGLFYIPIKAPGSLTKAAVCLLYLPEGSSIILCHNLKTRQHWVLRVYLADPFCWRGTLRPFIYLSIYLSIHLSVCLVVCLSVCQKFTWTFFALLLKLIHRFFFLLWSFGNV